MSNKFWSLAKMPQEEQEKLQAEVDARYEAFARGDVPHTKEDLESLKYDLGRARSGYTNLRSVLEFLATPFVIVLLVMVFKYFYQG